ncbi:MAG: GNAT family N-acetyltransferase [Spartobacteria bacterium]|nr:GNAT family N-acetyltransferase [Spartobacteria bacterium]
MRNWKRPPVRDEEPRMSKRDFSARPLAPQERAAWDALAQAHGCVFDTSRWTEIFGPALRRIGIYDAGDRLRGGFCFYEQRKLGLRILRNPPYTPQIGPFFEPQANSPSTRTDERRAVAEAMAEYLAGAGAALVSLGLSVGWTDCLPFFWRGWKVVPHYTYRMPLAGTEDDLAQRPSKQLRKHLRSLAVPEVAVAPLADAADMVALVQETFARQGMDLPPYTREILAAFPVADDAYGCEIRVAGRVLAARYVIHDGATAFAIMGGHRRDERYNDAGALASWQTVLEARRRGLATFDFEGSVIPPIERFYRGFGGELTPRFTVHKAWLPIELGLHLHPRFRSRF